MKYILIGLWVALGFSIYMLCVSLSENAKRRDQVLIRILEQAYFQGQKNAINGNIRIKLGPDSVYYWTKSPWEDNRKATFIPTKADTK